MGGFVTSPIGGGQSGPPQQQPSPMDTLMGGGPQLPQDPQQAELQAQAGALDQLRQMEMAIGTLSQLTQQMASAYPGGAQSASQTMQLLEQARQSLLGMLVPMMSGMPDGQPRGPAYMGG